MKPETKPFLVRCAAFGLALSLAPAFAGEKYAIKAGRIMTAPGSELENGVIVMEGGRITAVGKADEVEVPWDAEVLDVPNLVAFPGFVEAHSSRGMDRSNENLDVTPFLNLRDSIDPVNFYFEDALRSGITTINVQHGQNCVVGGQGMVVRPHGMTVEQMLVRPDSGLKMVASPKSGKSHATQAQALRGAFDDLRRHLEDLVQEKKDGKDYARREALYQGRELDGEKAKGKAMGGSTWKVEGLEQVPRGEIAEEHEALLDVVEGRIPVWFECGGPMDVSLAVEVAKANGFLEKTALVLDNSCWKAADEIAASGRPVVLDSNLMHTERNPVTGEEVETFVPSVFKEKGVKLALQSAGSGASSLWYQAARCVAHGFTREEALAAVTTTPAEMLGLGDRVGKLEAGMDASVVLFSGDPLSVQSFVEYVVIGGDLVYDRSKDVRAKHLLEGVEPEGTMPVGMEDGAGGDVHEHEGPGEEGDSEDGDEDGDDDGEEDDDESDDDEKEDK